MLRAPRLCHRLALRRTPMMVRCLIIALLLRIPDSAALDPAALDPAALDPAAPDMLWTTNPTRPNETLVAVFTNLQGAAGPENITAEIKLRGDADIFRPALMAADNTSVTFIVPDAWDLAVYEVRVCDTRLGDANSSCSSWNSVNDADPMWAQGNLGAVTTIGANGWLRVFGRGLAFADGRCLSAMRSVLVPDQVSIRLTPADDIYTRESPPIVLSNLHGSCFDLRGIVPAGTPPGRYLVSVRNNLPGASWREVNDGRPITVMEAVGWASRRFIVDAPAYNGNVQAALTAAGAQGGGRVELTSGKTYSLPSHTALVIPDNVTLTTARSSAGKGHRSDAYDSVRAVLEWPLAAPSRRHTTDGTVSSDDAFTQYDRLPCTGPTTPWANPDWHRECPPLIGIWARGALVGVHVRAASTAPLVGVIGPSNGALITQSVIEVVGREPGNQTRGPVNVSNALWIGNASGFTIVNNTILHIAEGAEKPGGNYGGQDTPAPCGQYSPNVYGFFFTNGAHDGSVINNTVVMGCNGWGTQSSENVIVEGNTFTSVGLLGVQGSGFSSASSVPRAKQNAFLRNQVRGTNAATGKHKTTPNPWNNYTWNYGPKADPLNPMESLTSDGSYGGYFGYAVQSDAALGTLTLAGPVSVNPSTPPGPKGHGWKEAALVVVSGKGVGQIRSVVSNAENNTVVRLNKPLTTPVDQTSVVTIAPWVGRWLVVGNNFANGTSVQTYGITLHAIFADNTLHNMSKSVQVTPAGICLTSLQYGTGVMPNMYFEVTGNTQVYSEGVHLRGSIMNGTITLTYGFAIRNNTHSRPLPVEYLMDHNGEGRQAGAQISVGDGCKSGVVEWNRLEPAVMEGIPANATIQVIEGTGVVRRENELLTTLETRN